MRARVRQRKPATVTKQKRSLDVSTTDIKSLYKETCSHLNKRSKVLLASLEDERAYGQRTIVKLRQKIKLAKTRAELLEWVTVAIMLGYEIVVRRGKVQLFEHEQVMVKSKSRNRKGPTNGGEDPVVVAMTFYMCWRYRKDENPTFRYLSRDTVLMICYRIIQPLVDSVMSEINV